MRLFDFLTKRRTIKEVSSWDGSASNYSTPESYAKASLINFNPAAGNTSPDTWSKDLIKLPVRNEGDAATVFIKQAVQAASGGRGLTRVTKPDDVSQEDFDRLRKAAANKIISAYSQWGGTAPDSIYEIAGKEQPVKRATFFSHIYEDVKYMVGLADMSENKKTLLYDIYYDEFTGKFYCLGVRDGIPYKIEIIVTPDGLMLGEFIPIAATDLLAEKPENNFRVFRGKDDQMRWLSIAGVAVLNRIGQIDSRELFDSFIDFATRTGYFPTLDVYHFGEGAEIGKADLLARRDYVYIASGYFYDDRYGRAFYRALQERNDWGNSIEFYSPRAYIENFYFEGASIQVPVYRSGINTRISLVREVDAASVMTVHTSKGGI